TIEPADANSLEMIAACCRIIFAFCRRRFEMQRASRLIGGVFLCALAGACAAPAPPDTREADARAIRDLEAAWTKDAAAKDVDKWANYMAEDSVVLEPNEPIVHGREKAKEMIKAMVADPNFAISFQPTQVDASKGGDFVYSVGTYSMTMSDKD